MHDLGTLASLPNSQGLGINAGGAIVGFGVDSSGNLYHAFLYDGTMHDLGILPGRTSTSAHAINSFGQIVGNTFTPLASNWHATYYDSVRGMLDLNTVIPPSSGWELQQGDAINDYGQIMGTGLIGGQTHTFLLTPLPEPSTLALGLIGFMTLFGYRALQRRSRCVRCAS